LPPAEFGCIPATEFDKGRFVEALTVTQASAVKFGEAVVAKRYSFVVHA